MPQCPKCSAVLQEDYGMVNCPSCGKFLFIDMDGVAHMGNEATRVGASPEEMPAPVVQEEPPFAFTSEAADVPSFDAPMSQPAEVSAYDVPSGAAFGQQENWSNSEPLNFETPSEAPIDSSQEAASDYASPAIDQGEEAPADFNMDGLLGYQSDDQPAAIDLGTSDQPGPPNDPLGISGYANSEISQAKDGLLVFKILILGIDSKEIRESLREAIEDVRFGWDPNTIMARIQRGVLEIENVSPVKATILVNRIKRLPIKIRWEQYAITQIEDV